MAVAGIRCAGVAQGRPVSGWVLVLAMSCLLRLLRETLGDSCSGVVRTCAADIGFSMTDNRLQSPFSGAELRCHCLSSLDYRQVALAGDPTELTSKTVGDWVREEVPKYDSMQVSFASRYLGFMLELEGRQSMWQPRTSCHLFLAMEERIGDTA